jgi:hypothetical protein
VILSLRHEIPGLVAAMPDGGKVERPQAVSPQVESGNVRALELKEEGTGARPVIEIQAPALATGQRRQSPPSTRRPYWGRSGTPRIRRDAYRFGVESAPWQRSAVHARYRAGADGLESGREFLSKTHSSRARTNDGHALTEL